MESFLDARHLLERSFFTIVFFNFTSHIFYTQNPSDQSFLHLDKAFQFQPESVVRQSILVPAKVSS